MYNDGDEVWGVFQESPGSRGTMLRNCAIASSRTVDVVGERKGAPSRGQPRWCVNAQLRLCMSARPGKDMIGDRDFTSSNHTRTFVLLEGDCLALNLAHVRQQARCVRVGQDYGMHAHQRLLPASREWHWALGGALG